MLVIDIKRSANENKYKHICDFLQIGSEKIFSKDKKGYEPGKSQGIEILQHDVHTYMSVPLRDHYIAIHSCPFCGVLVDGEERP